MFLDEVCGEIRNYFVTEDNHNFGKWSISGGKLVSPPDNLKQNCLFHIKGSMFNDGVYTYGDTPIFIDEDFEGSIDVMSVPQSFIELAAEIENFDSNNKNPSMFTSESFGGYSYSKATNSKGVPVGWREVYGSRLKRWRKI